MKRYLCSLIILVVLVSLASTVMAEESESLKKIKEFETLEVIDGELVEVSSQEVSITEQVDGVNVLSQAGKRYGKISNHKTIPIIGGNWYTVAKSTADYKQDQITARARLYNKNGKLWASDYQSLKNSKNISATANSKNNQINFNGAYSIGNHTFNRGGYKDTSLETKKNW